MGAGTPGARAADPLLTAMTVELDAVRNGTQARRDLINTEHHVNTNVI